uniref:Uncharacterized protein n=1 Tax=Anopheles minimus TaxID=112268 RepID=A0A182WP76_9DIPT
MCDKIPKVMACELCNRAGVIVITGDRHRRTMPEDERA